jgi:hypothetical protein
LIPTVEAIPSLTEARWEDVEERRKVEGSGRQYLRTLDTEVGSTSEVWTRSESKAIKERRVITAVAFYP